MAVRRLNVAIAASQSARFCKMVRATEVRTGRAQRALGATVWQRCRRANGLIQVQRTGRIQDVGT